MKKTSIFPVYLLSLFIVFILLLSTPVSAASAKKKAMKAYRALLGKKVITYRGNEYSTKERTFFAPVYVDNDNVPELVIFTDEGELALLYSYRNGKVSRVSVQEGGMGTPRFVYYEKTGIFRYSLWPDGALGFKFYRLSAGKSKLVMKQNTQLSSTMYLYDTVTPLDEYYINGKRVNSDTYNTYLRQITKGKSSILKSGVKNTKKNRAKYLK